MLIRICQERNNMCGMSFYMARTIALTLVVACGCYAQTLNIWPGVAPGSETWNQKEKIEKGTPVGTVVFNVVTPTLTPYLPERTKATGTGIIIAPGGAFVAVAIDLEGHQVALCASRIPPHVQTLLRQSMVDRLE